MIDEDGSKTI